MQVVSPLESLVLYKSRNFSKLSISLILLLTVKKLATEAFPGMNSYSTPTSNFRLVSMPPVSSKSLK